MLGELNRLHSSGYVTEEVNAFLEIIPVSAFNFLEHLLERGSGCTRISPESVDEWQIGA